MSAALTERQRDILAAIRTSVATTGWPPSIREIGIAVGLASVSSVHRQLGVLEERGYIRRSPGQPRTIAIVAAGPNKAAVEDTVPLCRCGHPRPDHWASAAGGLVTIQGAGCHRCAGCAIYRTADPAATISPPA